MPDTPHRPPRSPLVAGDAVDHHIADMTATVGAAVTLGALQTQLAREGQWLPIDGDPDAPIGKLVETNSTGPLRLGFGAWRDLLLGCQFHNGSGELISPGGRTMKNVAGYDLTKFMVGQRGIFGTIVTITTRVYRRPAAAMLAVFDPDPATLLNLLPTDCRPQWTMLSSDKLLCGYVGDDRTIDFYARAVAAYRPVQSTRTSLDEDIRLRRSLWRSGDDGFRAAVPPMMIQRFAKDASLDSWIADAAFGIVLGRCEPDRRSAVQQAAAALRGTATFNDACDIPPGQRQLLNRLKKAFDPDHRLPSLDTMQR